MKGFLITTFTAAAAGAAIGVLLAPAKGSETRQKITDSADNLRRKLRNLTGTTNDELNELQEVFEKEVTGLRTEVKEKILRLIEASKKSYNNVRQEAMQN